MVTAIKSNIAPASDKQPNQKFTVGFHDVWIAVKIFIDDKIQDCAYGTGANGQN